MKKLRRSILFLSTVLIALPCLGDSGVPSLSLSTAAVDYSGPGSLTLMVVPDASGPTFAGAADPAGNLADATIEVFLADPGGYPVVGYPREDIWLEWDASTEGLAICTPSRWGGVFPSIHMDIEMDDQGISHFSLPPHAGGHAEGPVYVVISGSRLLGNPGLPLRFNSPDISGDGMVNLADVVPLAEDFFGEYHFRSDLAHDGQINLSDVAKLVSYMGAGCPE